MFDGLSRRCLRESELVAKPGTDGRFTVQGGVLVAPGPWRVTAVIRQPSLNGSSQSYAVIRLGVSKDRSWPLCTRRAHLNGAASRRSLRDVDLGVRPRAAGEIELDFLPGGR